MTDEYQIFENTGGYLEVRRGADVTYVAGAKYLSFTGDSGESSASGQGTKPWQAAMAHQVAPFFHIEASGPALERAAYFADRAFTEYRWASDKGSNHTTITYSFYNGPEMDVILDVEFEGWTKGIAKLSGTEKHAIAALKTWERYADLSFEAAPASSSSKLGEAHVGDIQFWGFANAIGVKGTALGRAWSPDPKNASLSGDILWACCKVLAFTLR